MQFKPTMAVIEKSVHGLLHPLGFKKQKSHWRRNLPEVLQQFTIASMQLGARYRPEWGLNLPSRSEDPRPRHYELHVRWVLEQFVRPHERVMSIFDAFDLASSMQKQERIDVVAAFVNDCVAPCFEMYKTEAAIREMVGHYKSPLRAQMVGLCPAEWKPQD